MRNEFITPVRIYRLVASRELSLTNLHDEPVSLAYAAGKPVAKDEVEILKSMGVKDAGRAPTNKDASKSPEDKGASTRKQQEDEAKTPAELLVIGRSRDDLLALAREERIDTSELKGNVSKDFIAGFILDERMERGERAADDAAAEAAFAELETAEAATQ